MGPLERDQEFFRAMLAGESYLDAVTVLAETKGETEASILQKLSTLNKKGGKIGLIAVVLEPELRPSEAETRGPEYFVRITVQVIEDRLTNRTAAGTNITSGACAHFIRQVCHRRNFGFGPFMFAGMTPAPQQVTTRESKLVFFERRARDEELPKLPAVLITPEEGAAPQVVTLEGFPGATIRYSLDGSYPSLVYTVPVAVNTAATIRAVQSLTGYAPSDIAAATFD